MQTRRMAVAAAILTVLVGGVGCGGDDSDSSPNEPSAGATAPAKTPSTPSGGKTTKADSSKSAATLAGLDYCALLSAASLSPLGYQPGDGKPDTMKNLYDGGCKYDNRSTRVSLLVDIDTATTIDTSQGRTFEVSGFPNAASYDTATSCQLDVQVGKDQLHVAVENFYGDTPAVDGKLCDVAADFAKQVVNAAARR
ncbi:DUF3558 family protein (plasmid) [Streptomycetaceae bacterium NBC_01309]